MLWLLLRLSSHLCNHQSFVQRHVVVLVTSFIPPLQSPVVCTTPCCGSCYVFHPTSAVTSRLYNVVLWFLLRLSFHLCNHQSFVQRRVVVLVTSFIPPPPLNPLQSPVVCTTSCCGSCYVFHPPPLPPTLCITSRLYNVMLWFLLRLSSPPPPNPLQSPVVCTTSCCGSCYVFHPPPPPTLCNHQSFVQRHVVVLVTSFIPPPPPTLCSHQSFVQRHVVVLVTSFIPPLQSPVVYVSLVYTTSCCSLNAKSYATSSPYTTPTFRKLRKMSGATDVCFRYLSPVRYK